MMPWEHAIVGYIGYSLFVRAFYRETPTAEETLVVVFASLLPDLIDKPLAWQFDLFATGHAFAHSVFVAVPLSVAVMLFAYRRGSPRYGLAFGIGYPLHLFADVFPQYIFTGELRFHRVFWPFQQEASGYDAGFGGEARENLTEHFRWMATEIISGNPDPYLLVLLGLGVFWLVLWRADGMPVGRELYAFCRQTLLKKPAE